MSFHLSFFASAIAVCWYIKANINAKQTNNNLTNTNTNTNTNTYTKTKYETAKTSKHVMSSLCLVLPGPASKSLALLVDWILAVALDLHIYMTHQIPENTVTRTSEKKTTTTIHHPTSSIQHPSALLSTPPHHPTKASWQVIREFASKGSTK